MALEKVAFKSIIGRQWHDRLRGFEVDDRDMTTKTVGRQYVLERRDLTRAEIVGRLHNLCESVGFRLRSQGKSARGIYVYAKTVDHKYWHACKMCQLPFYSDKTINFLAQQLFLAAPSGIREIGMRCYGLTDESDNQISLFGDELADEQQLGSAVDTINRRFGDRTIHSANTLETTEFIKAKIPFGSTRYL